MAVELAHGAVGAVEEDLVLAVVVEVEEVSFPGARLGVGPLLALDTDERGCAHHRVDAGKVGIAGRRFRPVSALLAGRESWSMQSGPIVSVEHCGCEHRVKSGIHARYRAPPGYNNHRATSFNHATRLVWVLVSSAAYK